MRIGEGPTEGYGGVDGGMGVDGRPGLRGRIDIGVAGWYLYRVRMFVGERESRGEGTVDGYVYNVEALLPSKHLVQSSQS